MRNMMDMEVGENETVVFYFHCCVIECGTRPVQARYK